jgi:hypothetical protein
MQGYGNDERQDFNQSTWISLIGLLHPRDFFVTVDNTDLWRSHIAWAKPKGSDIKDYTTQRFSSSMIFLSLLLGADMNILFNSAAFATEIRLAMTQEDYGSLKFYIGCILLLGACVAVLGLVTTFTAWGMISAISDINSHCLLRSSMGQYVTSLPSRFVVAALYLFLLWLMLFIVELLSGPFRLFMVALVVYLFLQVVVSLSAFGRLIIHTGAMGRKRVLDPEFERHLLPSGLHASLLIKATERRRRRTSANTQYSTPQRAKSQGSGLDSSNSSFSQRRRTADSRQECGKSSDPLLSPPISSEEQESILNIATLFSGQNLDLSSNNDEMKDDSRPGNKHPGHRRHLSSESIESVDEAVKGIKFPRPSVLNRVGSHELRDVLEMTLSQSANNLVFPETEIEEKHGEIPAPPEEDDTPHTQIRKMARRRSAAVLRKENSQRVLQEWEAEEDVRNMYDITPPVNFWDDDDGQDFDSDMRTMPRASMLNRSYGLNSLRSLVEMHASGRNVEQIAHGLRTVQEESSPSPRELTTEESKQEYETFDTSTNEQSLGLGDSVDEEAGLEDESAGSERQYLMVKATRNNMMRGLGNRDLGNGGKKT